MAGREASSSFLVKKGQPDKKVQPDQVLVELPRGCVGPDGSRQRDVLLRASRVRDEVRALQDFRVVLRPDAFDDVLLARVIQRIGTIEPVDVGCIERLEAEDRQALRVAYQKLNGYVASPCGNIDGTLAAEEDS